MNSKLTRFSFLLCSCLAAFAAQAAVNPGQPVATSDVQAAFQRMLDYRAAETTATQQSTPTPLPLRDSLTAVLWSKTTDANKSRGNR